MQIPVSSRCSIETRDVNGSVIRSASFAGDPFQSASEFHRGFRKISRQNALHSVNFAL